jgi:hypothetical protein
MTISAARGCAHMKYQIHLVFSQLQINPATFDPHWNRDYTIAANSPQVNNEAAPAGWIRPGNRITTPGWG